MSSPSVRIFCSGSFATALLFAPGEGWSQANTPAPLTKPAAAKASNPLAQRLLQADEAFSRREFARALELYRQVDAIEATARTRLGIADCQRALGDLPAAYDTYEQLRRERTALSRKAIERVEQALATLGAATAALEIQVSEPDARVTIDNVDIGVGPLDKVKRRMPGALSVTVSKPGFETLSQQLVLYPGEERRLVVNMTPLRTTGVVAVHTTSAEPAQLLVDGKSVGALPFTGELSAGEHVVVASSANGESTPRKLTVKAGGSVELELAIVAKPASLRITALDPAAVILLDGNQVATGSYEGAVPPGNHVVTIERSGYVPKVTQVMLEPGERVTLDNVALDSANHPDQKQPPAYRGLYVRVGLDALLGRPTSSIATACPAADDGGSCQSYLAAGGALDIRVGYSFGLVAAELFTLLGTTMSAAKMTFPSDLRQDETTWYGIARDESYLLVDPMAAIGAAGRVSSRSQGVRLSSAWGAGLAWRAAYIGRTLEGISSDARDGMLREEVHVVWTRGGTRTLPILIWDADIELGDTPGTRFTLGLHSQLELGESRSVNVGSGTLGRNPDGSVIPFGGGEMRSWGSPNFFIGPKLGLIVGH